MLESSPSAVTIRVAGLSDPLSPDLEAGGGHGHALSPWPRCTSSVCPCAPEPGPGTCLFLRASCEMYTMGCSAPRSTDSCKPGVLGKLIFATPSCKAQLPAQPLFSRGSAPFRIQPSGWAGEAVGAGKQGSRARGAEWLVTGCGLHAFPARGRQLCSGLTSSTRTAGIWQSQRAELRTPVYKYSGLPALSRQEARLRAGERSPLERGPRPAGGNQLPTSVQMCSRRSSLLKGKMGSRSLPFFCTPAFPELSSCQRPCPALGCWVPGRCSFSTAAPVHFCPLVKCIEICISSQWGRSGMNWPF